MLDRPIYALYPMNADLLEQLSSAKPLDIKLDLQSQCHIYRMEKAVMAITLGLINK